MKRIRNKKTEIATKRHRRFCAFLWLFLPFFLVGVHTSLAAVSSDVADAVMKRDGEALRRLLPQKNADVNAPQPDGTTALHWAARWDDVEMARDLARAGANARAANRAGATPLFLAAMNGSAAMIETLLKAGADPNAAVLSHGETALMMAARTGKLEAVKVLLDHGAR